MDTAAGATRRTRCVPSSSGVRESRREAPARAPRSGRGLLVGKRGASARSIGRRASPCGCPRSRMPEVVELEVAGRRWGAVIGSAGRTVQAMRALLDLAGEKHGPQLRSRHRRVAPCPRRGGCPRSRRSRSRSRRSAAPGRRRPDDGEPRQGRDRSARGSPRGPGGKGRGDDANLRGNETYETTAHKSGPISGGFDKAAEAAPSRVSIS